MSDRKYSQRGYQDSDRDRDRRERTPAVLRKPLEKFDPRIPRDPKAPNMMGFKETFRCVRCGVALRACIQCASFDSSALFECQEKLPRRVSPKDEPNDCRFFGPRMKVEKETHSTPAPVPERVERGARPSGPSAAARKAFDDLFKS